MKSQYSTLCVEPHRNRGFTLLELVVSLMISAIVVGMAAMVLTAPTGAYFDGSRRSGQTDSADLIVRRLANDLKRALPNSVRISSNGNRSIIELLRYDTVSFYRNTGELSAPPVGPWPQTERELSATQNDTRFSVFGRLDPDNVNYDDHFISVNNRGDASLYDAYRPNNYVMTPARVTITVQRDASNEESITIAPGFRFRNAAAINSKQRMFFVSGPVAYICNAAANTQSLRRYENYAIANAPPTAETNARLTAAGVTNALVANNVSACRFRCQGGATTARPCRGGLVVELTVNRTTSSGNETVRVLEQFPVDNAS